LQSTSTEPLHERLDLVNKRDIRQVVALLAIQAVTYAVPLILVPFLGRTLGRDGFGRLSIAQSLGAYISVIVQYGFNYSGSRAIAKFSSNGEALADNVRNIIGAKAVLSAGCVLLGYLLAVFGLNFSLEPRLFWSTILWGIVNGYTLVWFFQGVSRLEICTYVDCAGRIGAIGVVLFLVRRPSDCYLVLLLQAGGAGIAIALEAYLMYRQVAFRWLNLRESLHTLQRDFHVFASRCVESVYLSGTSLILGITQPASEVGRFAGPEKIVRAIAYGIFPAYQVTYPRLVRKLSIDKEHALRYAKITMLLTVGIASAIAVLLWLGAGPIVRLALGPEFASSSILLKTLSPLVILMVAVGGVGSNLMLALNRDKYLTRILAIAGAFCAIATYILSAHWGAMGGCLALLATYLLILGLVCGHFRRWAALETGPTR
jgi:O-antigen/teichoic acid export membrane protein